MSKREDRAEAESSLDAQAARGVGNANSTNLAACILPVAAACGADVFNAGLGLLMWDSVEQRRRPWPQRSNGANRAKN